MKPTEREIQIYQYTLDYMQEHMHTLTIQEIGKAVEPKSTSSVATNLMHLEAKGMIEVGQDSSRVIRLVGYSIVHNSTIEELNRLRIRNNGLII